jgi:ribosomal protein L12E/L44/L45/RPP1/RPP2
MADSEVKLRIGSDVAQGIAGVEKFRASVKKMESDTVGIIGKIKSHWLGFASALAIPLSIGGFAALIKQTTEAAEKMELLMQKTGASYETLKVLSYTAKLSGTDIEGVSKAMGILAKNMQGAAVDMDGSGKSFKALGIETKDTSGHLKSIDTILPEISDRFSTMADGTGKTAYAMALFGKSGKDMIPILNQG